MDNTVVAPKRRWTVMAYLAGDNNLTDECVSALTEMKEVEGLDAAGIQVLAQFDPRGSRLRTHRYEISHTSARPSLSADFKPWVKNKIQFHHPHYRAHSRSRYRDPDGTIIRAWEQDYETNTGSPVTLFDFVTWCIEQYPAESYTLILSGHGGGSEKGYFLRDEDPADSLTIWEMQVALEAIKTLHNIEVDILGMDSCLMTMMEVSYQLHGLAKTIVGSEGYSPIAGWPYKQVLERMKNEIKAIPVEEADPTSRKKLETKALAKGIVEEYVNFYLDYAIGGMSVEQSALDLDAIETLNMKERIDNLANALIRGLQEPSVKNSIVLAHWEAQSYNGETFVDLFDFCDLLLKKYNSSSEIETACKQVLDTESECILGSCYSGPVFQYSRGLSIYFPWYEIDRDYYAVRFSRFSRRQYKEDSPWLEFLKAYIIKTRRKQRDMGEELFGNNDDPFSARHAPGRHAPGKSDQPQILSMRNPAVSSGLSPCIRAKRQERDTLSEMSKQLW